MGEGIREGSLIAKDLFKAFDDYFFCSKTLASGCDFYPLVKAVGQIDHNFHKVKKRGL